MGHDGTREISMGPNLRVYWGIGGVSEGPHAGVFGGSFLALLVGRAGRSLPPLFY